MKKTQIRKITNTSRKQHYNLRDSYIDYLETTDNPVDIDTYLDINLRFMKYLSDSLVENGEIKLPGRLGTVYIKGTFCKPRFEDGKIKGLSPDWAETNKLWEEDEEAKKNKQLVFHLNEETNGVRYKYSWLKGRVLVSNKTLYDLTMTRANKKKLVNSIREGKEYIIK